MQNKKGFTLIELMIVVAIIAILAMIAVPMYQRYIERARNAAAQASLEQISTAMVAYSTESSVFLPSATITTAIQIGSTLALYGFRPDPNIGLEFLAPPAANPNPGFIVYAAHRARGSRLFVYDNLSGSGVQTMGSLTNFLDPTTGLVGTQAATTACGGVLSVLIPNPADANTVLAHATTPTINVDATGHVQ